MVTKVQTIALLESISRLLELKGENPFKIRAYTNAARALEPFSGNLRSLVEEKRLEELEGIGSAIAKKIEEFATTGALGYYQELRSSFPDTLSELFELQGLGAKKIKVLWETLKVKSIADLEAACRDGRVAELPGFGEKTAQNFLRAIERREEHSAPHLLSAATTGMEQQVGTFRDHPAGSQISARGSLRKAQETIR